MIQVVKGNIHDRATDGPSKTVPGIAAMAVLLVSWSMYPSIAIRGYFVYFANSIGASLDDGLSSEAVL